MDEFSDLLRRAKEGDSDALGDLLKRYEKRLDVVIRRRMGFGVAPLRRQFDTSDLRQSVFREVVRGIPKFKDLGEDKFWHLLQMKAKSRVARGHRRELRRDALKKQQRVDTNFEDQQKSLGPGPATQVGDADGKADLASRLDAALATLTPVQRDVVRMHEVERLEFDEIARRLALPSGAAAKMRHARALKILAERCRTRPT